MIAPSLHFEADIMTITQTIITSLLAAFFLFASSIKILGWQKMIFTTQLAFFVKYGLNRQWMLMVGVLEFVSAVMIITPMLAGASIATTIALIGAALLAAVSMGAMACHLWFDTWKDGIPAMVTFALSMALVLYGV
ncbi:DoxX family protein [Photobacterium rosenbergii]|uniref:DoxX family protein n=1 Tax=Photobacterium rosenbergii TaxID=294936 RepID=UPI0021BD8681|nr:DoxX family protein [Photobacterium rosenbergii]